MPTRFHLKVLLDTTEEVDVPLDHPETLEGQALLQQMVNIAVQTANQGYTAVNGQSVKCIPAHRIREVNVEASRITIAGTIPKPTIQGIVQG